MQDHILEIILAIVGYFINRSILGMDTSVKELTTSLQKTSLEFASFASKTEAILEQHEKDIESLKHKPEGRV